MSQDQLSEYVHTFWVEFQPVVFLSVDFALLQTLSQRSNPINYNQLKLKVIITLDQSWTRWPFPCFDYWLPVLLISMSVIRGSSGPQSVMMIIEIRMTANVCVCVCVSVCLCVFVRVYGGRSGALGAWWGKGGGSQLSQGLFDWLMPDARWWMHTHIKPNGDRGEACRSPARLLQFKATLRLH